MKRFTILLLALCLAAFAASCQGSKDKGADKAEAPAAVEKTDKAEAAKDSKEPAKEPEKTEEPAAAGQGFDSSQDVGQAFCDAMVAKDVDAMLATAHPVMFKNLLAMAAEAAGDQDPLEFIKEQFALGFESHSVDSCSVENINDMECVEADIEKFAGNDLTLEACADLDLHMVGVSDGEPFDDLDKEEAGLIDGRWYLLTE
jgi:hypothetical protein